MNSMKNIIIYYFRKFMACLKVGLLVKYMYCGLVFYREFLKEDKQPLHYKKVKGTSAI